MCYFSFKNSTLHKTAIAPENSAWKDTFLSFWEFRPFFRGELLVSSKVIHLSHEKKPLTLHFTGCLKGIHIIL